MAGGFENTPITKSLCGFIFISTILFGNLNSKDDSHGGDIISLDLHELYKGQLWRILLSPLGFHSLPQLLVGLMLMYTFRQFERQLGLRKFGSLLCLSYLISILTQLAAIVLASMTGHHLLLTPGPFFFIFSLLPLFYQYIPRLHPLRISLLGLILSEKSWVYLLATQLLLCEGERSVMASIGGGLAGYLYLIEGLGFEEFRTPNIVEAPFRAVYGLVSGFFHFPGLTGRETERVRGGGRERERGRGMFGGLNHMMYPEGPAGGGGGGFEGAPSPPSEDSISVLTSIGFDRPAAIRALGMAGNNVEMAANILLSGG
mmetsp:Transcript_7286/g.7508  ORF Transcript_7286/g.7508 Transcript_7286/m.7508 type:complete len:316 (+) Transcript_7286:223-1170(+)